MFPVTITINTDAQLQAVLKALQAEGSVAVAKAEKPAPAPKAEAPKPPVAETPASSAPGAAPQTTAPVESAPVTETEGETTYTLDDAKRLTTECVKAGKRAEIVELLKEFNVAQAVKLAADQVAPFCQRAQELLK